MATVIRPGSRLVTPLVLEVPDPSGGTSRMTLEGIIGEARTELVESDLGDQTVGVLSVRTHLEILPLDRPPTRTVGELLALAVLEGQAQHAMALADQVVESGDPAAVVPPDTTFTWTGTGWTRETAADRRRRLALDRPQEDYAAAREAGRRAAQERNERFLRLITGPSEAERRQEQVVSGLWTDPVPMLTSTDTTDEMIEGVLRSFRETDLARTPAADLIAELGRRGYAVAPAVG